MLLFFILFGTFIACVFALLVGWFDLFGALVAPAFFFFFFFLN